MKTWYKAVCDTHKETCDVMVDNPGRTAWYLLGKWPDIQAWLSLHNQCSLRLIRHDHELDECYEKGYHSVKLTETPIDDEISWATSFLEMLMGNKARQTKPPTKPI